MSRPSIPTDPSPGELHALGIETIATKTYLWGGFRYSNARDAVAAAKRNTPS